MRRLDGAPGGSGVRRDLPGSGVMRGGPPAGPGGLSFGGFQAIREIGRGGMGVVYEGWDPSLRRKVAIKVLNPAGLFDPRKVERFYREAKACARLRHRSIVSVYHVGDEAGRPFIVMDFIEGETLSKRLKRGLSPRLAIRMVRDIAGALAAAHDEDIVHRDVKPQNIMVDKDGQAFLTDFGLAVDTSGEEHDLTTSGELVGTILYMAPEQLRKDEGAIGPWTDIYALGAVLYQVACARPPFVGDHTLAIVNQHLREAPVSPRRINGRVHPSLERIILRCLEKSPTDRFESAKELESELDRVLAEREVVGRAPRGPSFEFIRAIPRPVAIASAVAFVGVIGIVAGATLIGGGGESGGGEAGAGGGQAAGGDLPPPGVEGGGAANGTGGESDAARKARLENEARPHLVAARTALARSGGAELALVEADEAIRLAPGLGASHAIRARALMRLRRRGESIGSWDRAFELDPPLLLDFIHIDLDRAVPELAARRHEWLLALSTSKDAGPAAVANAMLLWRTGEKSLAEEASVALDEAAATAPDDVHLLVARALGQWRAQRWDAALALADLAVERHPDDPVARLIRGRMRAGRRRFAEAQVDWKRALEVRPDVVEPLIESAVLDLNLFRVERSRASFERARGLAPDSGRALTGLAACKCMRGFAINPLAGGGTNPATLLREARALTDEAFLLEPELPEAYMVRGWTSYLANESKSAVTDTARAVSLDPGRDFARRLHAFVLAELGRRAELESHREAWLARTSDAVEVHLSFGEAYASIRRMKESNDAFQRARELAPDDAARMIRHGRVLLQYGPTAAPDAAAQLASGIREVRRIDPVMLDDFCEFVGIPPSQIDMAVGMLERATGPAGSGNLPPELLAAQRLVEEGLRVVDADPARAERLFLEACSPPNPANPLPHIHLVTRIYMYPEEVVRTGRTEADAKRLALEHADLGVGTARGPFEEWLPVSTAVRALAEARFEMIDEARASAAAARRLLGTGRPDLDGEAERMLGQVEEIIRQVQSGGFRRQ